MMAENQTTCTRATGIEQSTAFAYICACSFGFVSYEE